MLNASKQALQNLRARPGLLSVAAFGLATAIYLFIAANTPLVIMVWQAYDDELFVHLARSLSEGRWLGAYNALTLAKGPGYSAFLAANYWTGLPVTLAHAGFYCASLGALAWVVFKKSGSHRLAFLFFLVPLFYPKILEPARILRDSIYMSQSVLVIAVFAHCLYLATGRRQLWSAVLAGLLLGWFWLTRDEGVWILPGLAVMVFFAWLEGRRVGASAWWRTTLVAIAVFLATQFLFAFLNLLTYGKFVGVEFKESNFQGAISAMESVQSAKPVPFVSVPRGTRMQLYAISPDFASLRPILDPVGTKSPWEAGGCTHRPTACGDLGNGFFMWAVRDAAERLGHFRSPRQAASFFNRIEADILKACEQGKLQCKQDWIPMLPPLTDVQLARIPVALGELFRELRGPGQFQGFLKDPILGTDGQIESTLSLLNQPQHYPKTSSRFIGLDVSGWYYVKDAGDEWFDVDLIDESSDELPREFTRVDSPDLVANLSDTRAAQQRFRISAPCGTACKLRFTSANGKVLDIPLSRTAGLPGEAVTVGNAVLAFDPSSAVQFDRTLYDDIRVRLAYHLRAALYPAFRLIMPVLMAAGLLCFLVAGAMAIRRRKHNFALALACTCWVLVGSRAVILVMVDISSFPAIHVPYLLPIFSLAIIAAIASIWACAWILRNRPIGRRLDIDALGRH